MRNLHKYYYKDYYSANPEQILKRGRPEMAVLNWGTIDSEDNKSIIKKRNGELCRSINNYHNPIEKTPLVNQSFESKIAYPGLVTGIGINHEAKIEGEFKLGVHFDWTHGMPIVYGSSVKGVLRSAFKDGYVDASLIEKANKKEGIREDEKVPTWVGDEANHKAILEDIFEGKENGKSKSIYERDIFFDAVIVEVDSKGRILASDSITPHGGENHDNPLKNPTPLTFMKIASGCTMEFRFKLVKTEIEKDGKTLTFTADQKRTLFEEILKTVGIGAKTNVGYGQLK